MCNAIFLGDKTFPDAKDGEKMEVTVNGVYHTDEDGTRKLEIQKIDGDPVGEIYDGESDCGCGEKPPHLMEQSADDALRLFIIKTKKG